MLTDFNAAKATESIFQAIFPVANTKRPPGNGTAFSLGRIVPTEAKPSELSGEILCLGAEGVKAKSRKI
jgi:hypothetical protein